MGLNICGTLTADHEKKITDRLIRAGFVIEDGGWTDTISYLEFSKNTEDYRRALFIFCRVVGMKPTMRAGWGWGHYGTQAD
jgi:hypothetical protein